MSQQSSPTDKRNLDNHSTEMSTDNEINRDDLDNLRDDDVRQEDYNEMPPEIRHYSDDGYTQISDQIVWITKRKKMKNSNSWKRSWIFVPSSVPVSTRLKMILRKKAATLFCYGTSHFITDRYRYEIVVSVSFSNLVTL